jgi:phage-related protein
MPKIQDDINLVGSKIRSLSGNAGSSMKHSAQHLLHAGKEKTIISALEFGPWNGFKLAGVIIIGIIIIQLFSSFQSIPGIIILIIFLVLVDMFFFKNWVGSGFLSIITDIFSIVIDMVRSVVDIVMGLIMTIFQEASTIGQGLIKDIMGIVEDIFTSIGEMISDIFSFKK